MNTRLQGLYAITPEFTSHPAPLTEQVADAIRGGARLIQYRNKDAGARERQREAEALLEICRTAGVPLIINDDLDLAVALMRGWRPPRARRPGSQGCPRAAWRGGHHRRLLLQRACLGRGRRRGRGQLRRLRQFLSVSPPNRTPFAPIPGLLTEARRRLRIPSVAIGGITPENGGLLIAAGARHAGGRHRRLRPARHRRRRTRLHPPVSEGDLPMSRSHDLFPPRNVTSPAASTRRCGRFAGSAAIPSSSRAPPAPMPSMPTASAMSTTSAPGDR